MTGPMFKHYTSKEMYEEAGIRWIEPMTAKGIEEEEKQDSELNNSNYIIEEKFDGTRATHHFFSDHTRLFSRRVSSVTGWFKENTDSMPHLRDLNFPNLEGTIIDGELFIPNRPFKDVSSTLNCIWDKAIERQEELGKIVLHAFDILYYKGICLMNMPLHRRKVYLQRVIDTVNSPYLQMVDFYSCDSKIPVQITNVQKIYEDKDFYPTLHEEVKKLNTGNNPFINPINVSPKAFYEYIVLNDGEGIILKDKDGKYFSKRGREYQKIKKFLTREVIITGFDDPEAEYKGKYPSPEKWPYWCTTENDYFDFTECTKTEIEIFKSNWYPDECCPVSKFEYYGWVGNIRYGVIITPEEISNLTDKKKFSIIDMTIESEDCKVLEVGDCSGFNEDMREFFTDNKDEMIGRVIEVKANEIFKDTGKMRHPRFLRMRDDKSPLACTWEDHIS